MADSDPERKSQIRTPCSWYLWIALPSIQLHDKTIQKIRAFGKIIQVILGESQTPEDDSGRVELIVSIGLDRMLQDVLPKEEPILQKTMTQMFALNPEFICDFVADRIRQGGEEEQDKQAETKKLWRMYA